MKSTSPTLFQPIENCFEEVRVKLNLQLPPMDTGSLCNGTKAMLDRLIFRYKKELDGIIISYYDIVHTDKEAKIFYDSPYLGINIQVKFLVFKPFNGLLLNGVVKRVSSTHISLLVFGIISASIPKTSIPKDFVFDHSANMFVKKQSKAKISVGTKIAFKVLDVSADRHNISIQGDMTDSSTGIIGFDENAEFSNNYSNNKTPTKNNKQQQTPNKSNEASAATPSKESTPTSSKAESSSDDKEQDSKKRKKDSDSESESDSSSSESESASSSSDSSSSESSSESEDERKKKKAKTTKQASTKNVKKSSKKSSSDSSSSDSSSSESESDKKKKKKSK
ncbi:hypothetical protein CYY_007181 [Polysphondylium violaceum]|uniref:S1 motif domain-containing protein n=1 Tax=Polysphondylium violaceum TaxID=133409 RepID=A0A8J4UY64_9MYCE|nr:hypothetical protein CYY_007181 [Polysphondylium violaceum]